MTSSCEGNDEMTRPLISIAVADFIRQQPSRHHVPPVYALGFSFLAEAARLGTAKRVHQLKQPHLPRGGRRYWWWRGAATGNIVSDVLARLRGNLCRIRARSLASGEHLHVRDCDCNITVTMIDRCRSRSVAVPCRPGEQPARLVAR